MAVRIAGMSVKRAKATEHRKRGERGERRRLDLDARRDELLRVGMELFSSRAYDEIWIEEIAEQAGISRGLLYHYFPSKRDFYIAVSKAAAEEVRQLTEPEPTLPADEQLRMGLDRFLRYAQEHPHGFLTAYRGNLAGDPEVRALLEEVRERQAARILRVLTSDEKPPPLLRLAVRGWIRLTQDITAQWLEDPSVPRETVSDLLIEAFAAIVGAAAPND